jgi:hypothetical protein
MAYTEIEQYLAKINSKYFDGKDPAPLWQHDLTYDSSVETLEPIYYWILDFSKGNGYDITKIADNFLAAPGSSYFADLSGRATRMQEEGMKILGAVNMVIKSVINILYDLKEFEIRLKAYESSESKNPREKQAGTLALKDIWMSNVDIKRGRGSINQMTYELGFTTLRDAFMKADSVEDIEKMKALLNERVRRVLKPRIAEFFEWKDRSYDELKRRYNIEQAYLKGQVDTLKLYSSWVRPYIKAAEQLKMTETAGFGLGPPELISAFGTMMLNLSLMLTKKMDVKDEVENKNLPEKFKKAVMRNFCQLVFIDFAFRTYPTQQFPHAGNVLVSFRGYAVNDEELLLLKEKMRKDILDSVLGLSQNLSTETLKQLEDEINYYLKRGEEKEKKGEKKPEASIFSGIFKDLMKSFTPERKEMELMTAEDIAKKAKKEEEEEMKKAEKIRKEGGVKPDTYEEEVVREYTELKAADYCFSVFDKFKKSRGMASSPNPFEEPDVYARLRERRAEIAAALAMKKAQAA